VGHGEVVERFLDPMVAELIEVGNQRDGDEGVLIVIQVMLIS
jgi:acetyl/propionyl-CoA carboxylase alpha subunit